jgi:hypothetical protein
MIFYLSIAFYISSVIAALIFMIIGRHISSKRFLILTATHGILFVFYFVTAFLSRRNADAPSNFTFLLFICSGVSLSGLVWRISVPLPLKIYFAAFALSFPMFLFSPSRLVNFLLTARYSDSLGKSFLVDGNVFLEQQNSWSVKTSKSSYKIIRKKGLFHQTLARDIAFDFPLDSIHLLYYQSDDTAVIRGFRIHESFVDTKIDSQDVHVSLKSRKRNTIERKLTP